MTRKQVVTAEDVRELKKLRDDAFISSIDAPISEDGDDTIASTLVDEEAVDPLHSAVMAAMVETMHEVLESLPARDRQIVSMRYGIGFDRPMTMEEVGAEFSISRERVRQIENAAMKTLRHPSRMRKMRVYSKGY